MLTILMGLMGCLHAYFFCKLTIIPKGFVLIFRRPNNFSPKRALKFLINYC